MVHPIKLVIVLFAIGCGVRSTVPPAAEDRMEDAQLSPNVRHERQGDSSNQLPEYSSVQTQDEAIENQEKVNPDELAANTTEPAYGFNLAADEQSIDQPYGDRFNLPAPDQTKVSQSETLWATWYNLHQSNDIGATTSAKAIRDLSGRRLGPYLAHRDWCFAAMEGSALVKTQNGRFATYNYAGTSSSYQVDCGKYFPHRLGGTKFTLAKGAFGDGVKGYKLVPYRTVAVDSSQKIPYGTVLYVAEARGTPIRLPDGTTVKHDGYFFAADTGGAIKGKHIDVFLGLAKANPFKWIKSSSKGTFKARIIKDAKLRGHLEKFHN